MLNRTIAPKITDAVDFHLSIPPYKRYALKNGVEVYAIDLGELDTFMVNLVFGAGNWHEEGNLIAATTNYLLKNGTSKKNAFEINEYFEYYGGYLNRSCQNETAEISLHCLGKYAKELLPGIAEIITDSIFPDDELDIYKKNSQQRLQVSLKKSDFVAARLIDAYLFGENHPYGKYSSLEDYSSLQRDEIKEFYQQYYQNGRCIIFMAGRLPGNIVDELDKNFGSLPIRPWNSAAQNIQYEVRSAREKKYNIVNDENGIQGSIRIARSFPNRHHPDFQKAGVLNNIFGGFFGSRLMANIREDKGYTYGIHSYLMNHMQQSAWVISTEAGKEVCSAAIHEVYKEMELLREELIDGEELLTAKNFMIGTILGDLDGPFQVAGRWKNIILNNLDENYFYNGIQVIKTITAEELRELANKYLKPEEFYELVLV
jgi:zinc protease